jgi:carboxypeptidase C (cathepsin A)
MWRGRIIMAMTLFATILFATTLAPGLWAALPPVPAKRPQSTPVQTARCAPPVTADKPAKPSDSDDTPPPTPPDEAWSDGSVTVAGATIDYCAVAGTLVVHTKGWDDAAAAAAPPAKSDSDEPAQNPATQSTMFYVAYFRRDAGAALRHDADATTRPVTFLFNGGPGSASLWLHMGAFGPRRVETADAMHSAPAPYHLINNGQSLLDTSDLVFIDAPGTGFSRVTGPDKDSAFYGVDEDARAFADFIMAFLSKYHRWNSPKYLFGESYGTTRAAVLTAMLEDNPGIDFNGVIMLSQVLATNLFPDQPRNAPGNDLPYLLALPSYAAAAWYHRQPPDNRSTDVPAPLLSEVERFAMGDYAAALAAGASLDAKARDAVVAKLHDYTSLPEDYLRQSSLRVGPDEFRQELLRDRGLVIGATDTRFAGQSLDRLSRRARYDPVDAAIGSAYVSTFNDYVRRVLKYGDGKTYRVSVDDIGDKWNFTHMSPDSDENGPAWDMSTNVLPDLAHAMTLNPLLKIQVNAGYYDLLTPYFEGKYEMRHLPIAQELRGNIEYQCYRSGHMVYLAADALSRLHDNVADFIARTSGQPAQTHAASSSCASSD